MKSQIQSLLESFRGVALASNLRNAHTLFSYLMPVLTNCVPLLNVYQNCPEVVVLVLEFYLDLIDSQITYLDEVSIKHVGCHHDLSGPSMFSWVVELT